MIRKSSCTRPLPHGLVPTMYTVQILSKNFSIAIHYDPSKQLSSSLPHGFGPTMYRISPMGYIVTHRSSCTRLCHTDLDLQCTEFHQWDTLWSVKAVVLVSATRIGTYNVQNFTIGIHCDPSKQLYSSLTHGLAPTMYTVQIALQNSTIEIHWDPSKQLYSSLTHGFTPTMYRISP